MRDSRSGMLPLTSAFLGSMRCLPDHLVNRNRALLQLLLRHGRMPLDEVARRAKCSRRTVERFLEGEPLRDADRMEAGLVEELASDHLVNILPRPEALRGGEAMTQELKYSVGQLTLICGHIALASTRGDATPPVALTTLALECGMRWGAYRALLGLPAVDEHLERALANFVAAGASRPRGTAGDAFEYMVRKQMKLAGYSRVEDLLQPTGIKSPRTLYDWLKGRRPVTTEGVLSLAAALTKDRPQEHDACLFALRCAAAVQDLQLRSGIEIGELRRGLRLLVECCRAVQATFEARPWSKNLIAAVLLRGSSCQVGQRLVRGALAASDCPQVAFALLLLCGEMESTPFWSSISSLMTPDVLSEPAFGHSDWNFPDEIDDLTIRKVTAHLALLVRDSYSDPARARLLATRYATRALHARVPLPT